MSRGMRRARQLAIFLFLVPIAAAQNPSNGPAEVTGINVSAEQETEVRIEIRTTAVVLSPEFSATSPESLVLDLPGAVYRALPRRIQVNHAGIRAVRLWMQSENPPLTRVVVEIDRAEQYLLSPGASSVVLRVGPLLKGASSDTPNTADAFGSRRTAPAARGSASALVTRALSSIFHRGPGNPTVSKGPKFEKAGQPVAANDPATQVAKSDPAPNSSQSALSAPQDRSAATGPLDATPSTAPEASQNLPAAPASTTMNAEGEPPGADSPLVEASKAATSTIEAASPSPIPTVQPKETTSDTPSAPTLEPAAARAGGEPNSMPDMRAVVAVANPGMRTEFHVKFVDQDSAYLDGGRSSGLTEGLKLGRL